MSKTGKSISKTGKSPVGRRGFLKGAAAGAAVLATGPELARAQDAQPARPNGRGAAVPSDAQVARENGNARPSRPIGAIEGRRACWPVKTSQGSSEAKEHGKRGPKPKASVPNGRSRRSNKRRPAAHRGTAIARLWAAREVARPHFVKEFAFVTRFELGDECANPSSCERVWRPGRRDRTIRCES